MKKINSVEDYIESNPQFSTALTILRDIMLSTEFEETVKWSMPTYCISGKNVLGLGAFKNHFCIWFHQGVFLKDEEQILINAQKDKTKALRQMRFETVKDINKNLVLDYVKEAIENQKRGRALLPNRKVKKVALPEELKNACQSNTNLNTSFKALTLGKQREYCDYIAEAKRATTKQSRLGKIIPMIIKGVGLYDKYKNC